LRRLARRILGVPGGREYFRREGQVAAHLADVDTRLAQGETRFAQVDTRLAQGDARLAEVDARLAQGDARLAEVDAHLAEVDARLAQGDAHLAEVDAHLAQVAASTEQLDKIGNDLAGGIEHLRAAIVEGRHTTELREQIDWLRSELLALPYMTDPSSLSGKNVNDRTMLAFESGDAKDRYLDFETLFRGSESFIKEQLQPYLELIAGSDIVDLGCGRGEMLELLEDRGTPGIGVDSDTSMVARCGGKGLVVEEADALEWLHERERESLDSVFSARFIEHLDFDAIMRLLYLAKTRLRSGGVFIAETINPHALHAWKTFWIDPGRRQPVFPEPLLALARETGFSRGYIRFVPEGNDAEKSRWQADAFALVAYA